MISKRDIKKLKPFKKKHTGLKIFLIVLCVILVLPIAFVFGAFYDPTTKKVSDTEVHYENIVSEAFYKGISNLSKEIEDGKDPVIGFTIDEEMIDGILMAACDKINQKQWIPKMYCYVNDNNYTFVMDAQASFFKTRALIHTNLDKQDNTLVFKITGITLGRLPLPLNLITGILGNFLNDETLNNAFSQSGFHIESHLSEAKLTYSRAQFKEDVGNYISNLGNSAYLDILLNTFDNPQVLSTDYKDGVSVNINLAELTKPVKTKEAPINFQGLENHRKEVEKLLNEKGLEEAGAPKVFTYLLRGNRSSEEIIKYIVDNPDVKTALLSYIGSGITDLKEYPGSFINDESNPTRFNEYCIETLNQDEVFTFDYTSTGDLLFKIPSYRLNKVLAYKLENIIGATIPVTFKENNTWGFQYIVIDNVYTGFTEASTGDNHEFDIYIGLNIGGVRTVLVITADNIGFELADNQEKLGHLKFNVKGIHFGSIDITSMKDSLADLIPSTGVFSYNKEKTQFEVSIDDLISDKINPTAMGIIHNYFKTGTPEPISKTIENDEFKLAYNVPLH